MSDDARQRSELTRRLEGRIPASTVPFVVNLLLCQPVQVVVTPPRRTRLGSYTSPLPSRPWHRITVNADLNPYAFLVTLLHEIAHMQAFRAASRRIAPHGREWKRAFGKLLSAVVGDPLLPEDFTAVISDMLTNPRASSCGDPTLTAVLSRYDEQTNPNPRVDELPVGCTFRLSSGRVFRHRRRLRTWHLCEEVHTRQTFRVRGSSQAELLHTADTAKPRNKPRATPARTSDRSC
jgi:SprT protein